VSLSNDGGRTSKPAGGNIIYMYVPYMQVVGILITGSFVISFSVSRRVLGWHLH